MRKLASLVALMGLSLPAFANPINVPEPGSLALVGVAVAAAIWAVRRGKK